MTILRFWSRRPKEAAPQPDHQAIWRACYEAHKAAVQRGDTRAAHYAWQELKLATNAKLRAGQ